MTERKYVIYPGNVRSRHDGEVHYINATRLMELYGVKPKECVIVMPKSVGYGLDNLIPLRPDPTGEYKLP